MGVKLEPKQVVSAWLSISDLAIVLGVVCALLLPLGLYVLDIFLGPERIEFTRRWLLLPASSQDDCADLCVRLALLP